MKNAIFAIVLAALAAPAVHAQAYNLVCGSVAVTVESNAANQIAGVTIDDVDYDVTPSVTRKVSRGKLHTFFQAGNRYTGAAATVLMVEGGDLSASIYTDHEVWSSECRFAG